MRRWLSVVIVAGALLVPGIAMAAPQAVDCAGLSSNVYSATQPLWGTSCTLRYANPGSTIGQFRRSPTGAREKGDHDGVQLGEGLF